MRRTPLTVQINMGTCWRTTIFIGLIFCVIFYVKDKPISMIAKALWAYVLIAALYTFESVNAPFGVFNTAFQATAGQVFAEALLIPSVVLLLSDRARGRLLSLMKWAIVCEIVCLWVNGPSLMGTPSFDTAFIALYLPFAPLWLIIASLLTICAHHGATALVIICAQLSILCLRDRKLWAPAVFWTTVIFITAYFNQRDPHGLHGNFFSFAERLSMYKRYMGFWMQEWKLITFGVGPGSFMWISMMIDKFEPPSFLWMHSDWLQILFELGAIGFLLAVGTFVKAAKDVWNDSRSLSALFGCAAFCLTYSPLRFFPTMLLMALIFRYRSAARLI